jgi:hypothetical protein
MFRSDISLGSARLNHIGAMDFLPGGAVLLTYSKLNGETGEYVPPATLSSSPKFRLRHTQSVMVIHADDDSDTQ